jgi:hypothetical protein
LLLGLQLPLLGFEVIQFFLIDCALLVHI